MQRQAARFVHGNYNEKNPGCVTRMVIELGWETHESRSKKDRLTTLYKIQPGIGDGWVRQRCHVSWVTGAPN